MRCHQRRISGGGGLYTATDKDIEGKLLGAIDKGISGGGGGGLLAKATDEGSSRETSNLVVLFWVVSETFAVF